MLSWTGRRVSVAAWLNVRLSDMADRQDGIWLCKVCGTFKIYGLERWEKEYPLQLLIPMQEHFQKQHPFEWSTLLHAKN